MQQIGVKSLTEDLSEFFSQRCVLAYPPEEAAKAGELDEKIRELAERMGIDYEELDALVCDRVAVATDVFYRRGFFDGLQLIAQTGLNRPIESIPVTPEQRPRQVFFPTGEFPQFRDDEEITENIQAEQPMMQRTETEKSIINIGEFAEKLRISKSRTYALIREAEAQGWFPVIRIGKAIRIPVGPVEEWLGRSSFGLEKV